MASDNSEKIGVDGKPLLAEGAATSNQKSKTSLDINLLSYHFTDTDNPRNRLWSGDRKHGFTSRPLNGQNWGAGVTHMREVWRDERGDWSVWLGGSAGQYRNSRYTNTNYLMANAEVDYRVSQNVNVAAGMQIGAVTGYKDHAMVNGQFYAKIERELHGEIAAARSVFAQFGVIPAGKSGGMSTPAVATTKVGITF